MSPPPGSLPEGLQMGRTWALEWALLEATGEWVVGLQSQAGPRGFLHLPVELIVVVVNFPPEVEPGESEAEGANQEQEPQAFPLQEQSRGQSHKNRHSVTASHRAAPTRAHSQEQGWGSHQEASGNLRPFCCIWRPAQCVLASPLSWCWSLGTEKASHRVSCSPGQPQTPYVAENGLECQRQRILLELEL